MPSKGKKELGSKNTASNASKNSTVTSPNWPVLQPVLAVEDLEVEDVLEGQILVVRNLFTSTLCKSLVAYFSTLPLITTPGKPKRGEASRVNDRFQVEDHVFAQQLWRHTALEALLRSHRDQNIFGAEMLGLNANIRIYRYKPGQFFDQHYDESKKLAFGPEGIPAMTTWTLLIYLTICEGGETIFYPEAKSKRERAPNPIVCGLEVGMALLHKHGDDCLLHEGSEVTSGEKWVLRSDLVVRR